MSEEDIKHWDFLQESMSSERGYLFDGKNRTKWRAAGTDAERSTPTDVQMDVKEVLPVEDLDSTISTVTQEDDKEDGTELTEEKSTENKV